MQTKINYNNTNNSIAISIHETKSSKTNNNNLGLKTYLKQNAVASFCYGILGMATGASLGMAYYTKPDLKLESHSIIFVNPSAYYFVDEYIYSSTEKQDINMVIGATIGCITGILLQPLFNQLQKRCCSSISTTSKIEDINV